jgi:hypothetical protein
LRPAGIRQKALSWGAGEPVLTCNVLALTRDDTCASTQLCAGYSALSSPKGEHHMLGALVRRAGRADPGDDTRRLLMRSMAAAHKQGLSDFRGCKSH